MTLKQDMKVYYETFPEALKYCDFCTRTLYGCACRKAGSRDCYVDRYGDGFVTARISARCVLAAC